MDANRPQSRAQYQCRGLCIKKYATKDNRDGSIEDHFGYEYPHRNVPSQSELEELHDVLREHWSGELPTVLDPTAGGGTIPFESLRYGLPTVSNELNPVAWLINEVILEYAPSEGSLDDELQVWIDKISSEVEDELEEYFPKRNGVAPNHYFRAYSIKCPSCGKRLPISNRWWFNRRRGVATRPYLEEGNLRFEIVRIPEDVEKSEFDPSKGTAGDGEIECPHCDVVTERDSIVELFKQGDFEFEVCGVQYEEEVEGHKYHSPTEQDRKAIKAAQDGLKTILSWPRF
jgi:adenine-specific DNA methylase